MNIAIEFIPTRDAVLVTKLPEMTLCRHGVSCQDFLGCEDCFMWAEYLNEQLRESRTEYDSGF